MMVHPIRIVYKLVTTLALASCVTAGRHKVFSYGEDDPRNRDIATRSYKNIYVGIWVLQQGCT